MTDDRGRSTRKRSLRGVIEKARRWANSGSSNPSREVETIRRSGLFDAEFYLAHNPGIAEDAAGALRHYVTLGAFEGRDPHPLFSSEWYASYARRSPRRISALMHYLEKGAASGLDPTPLFDTDFYLRQNRDVAASGENPLRHYVERGAYEGRDPHPLFDSSWYLEQNPEVAAAGANPLVHYVSRGWKENRNPHPLFDAGYLARTYPFSPPAGTSPLEFFCTGDLPLDANPSSLFDSAFYRYQLEAERDLTISGRPVLHYLERGHRDPTLFPNILFDPAYYSENNDVPPGEPALVHYRVSGDALGFATHPHFDAGVYNANLSGESRSGTALEHFFEAAPSETRISHKQMNRPISKNIVAVIRKIADDDYEFDLDTYLDMHPKVKRSEALRHYRDFGFKEGRSSNLRKLLKQKRLQVADIPLGFYHDEYLALNPDLQKGIGGDYLPLLAHYLQFGRAEARAIGKWQFYIDLRGYCVANPETPAALPAPSERRGVCLLMHIYYSELLPELVSYANSFGPNLQDVFINVVETSWTPNLHKKIRDLCPGAFTMLSKNAGRDIGGFLRLLDHVEISKYELFAFMHTKMSPHVVKEKAEFWRRKLLNAFAGNSVIASRSIEAFRRDPSIGLLASKDWRGTDIAANAANFEKMLDLFQIETPNRNVEYLSGTMFLIRPEIVQRIYDVLKDIEFESGEGGSLAFNMDGQLAHAIERVIGNVVRQMGYRMEWVDS